jgi:hypothetical protein
MMRPSDILFGQELHLTDRNNSVLQNLSILVHLDIPITLPLRHILQQQRFFF